MSKDATVKKLQDIEQIKKTINTNASKIGKLSPVFREMYSLPTNFTCFEAGFLRTISWLYMLYYEAGKGELSFAIEKFDVYQIQKNTSGEKHYQDLKTLRTTFQHSFDLEIARNLQLKGSTEKWFYRAINKNTASTLNDWQACLELLLNDALEFLKAVQEVVRCISDEEFSKSIVDDWNFKSSRVHAHHDFDSLIYTVSHEFGLEYLDIGRFRKQNVVQWIQELQNFTGNYEFKIEARKLIERDMIKKPILPITGEDVMNIFDVPPGPKVKKIIESAWIIFLQKPCSKDELIEKIKEEMKK